MTTETMPASDVLHEEQFIHITTNNEDYRLDLHGVITEISLRYLAIHIDCAPDVFLDVPAADIPLDCAVTGNGCVYRFTTSFRSSSVLEDMTWCLEKPADVNRVQMRHFVRVPIALPMLVKLPGRYGNLRNATITTLVDLSGGGLCFACNEEVPLQSRVAIAIPGVPLYGTLKTDALVERCTPIEVPSGTIYHVGVSLEGRLTPREQDKLVQSVFFLQRDYLRKGLRMPNLDHTHPANDN
ncbi:PilZ domain-containing protein [Selenomonas caprae]|uniref:PilZ domain-containing protein n=2 Tax=Selenomonas TaxID=970 RepID=A0A1I3G252_SELRU|nr:MULTISPECIES: PilZ domain-containing protein [Selenomonas]MBQ1889673.1 PilZ domain-containing protein [Selenomonas sp.]TYZ28201.1 PilZ domain-containing protein [Selenomonas caprae]SFI17544.1 PilZ domain-containing protein [Selenomonas ruminantium]